MARPWPRAAYEVGIILWDVAAHQSLFELLARPSGQIYSVIFSPDGKILASGTASGILLWEVTTHKYLGDPLTGPTDSIDSMAFSPDGKILASNGDGDSIILWDMETRRPLGEPLATGHNGSVNSVTFNRDGKTLASGGSGVEVFFNKAGTIFSAGDSVSEVILWDIDTESWQKRACRITGRTLGEWKWYFGKHGESYRQTCEQWPEGK